MAASVLISAPLACGGGAGDSSSDESTTASAAEGVAEATSGPSGDSLVLVMNGNEAPLHFTPADWPDLFHFRFADEVLMVSPESSPLARAFMEGVIEVEARRAGTVDAGFDWLRRLDTTVLAYEEEADDLRWRLRQGHAWFGLLPASEAGPLLEREGFRTVPLASGFDPSRWDTGSPAPEDESGSAGGSPEVPSDWFARWSSEVRGRG